MITTSLTVWPFRGPSTIQGKSMKHSLKSQLAAIVIFVLSLLWMHWNLSQRLTGGVYDDEALTTITSERSYRYSTRTIALVAKTTKLAPLRVLIYDPSQHMFEIYSFGPIKQRRYLKKVEVCGRCVDILPLLVDALWTVRPGRFMPDQPPFQLIFSDSDFFYSTCTEAGTSTCNSSEFAPFMMFGSAPRDPTIFPSCRVFPNVHYLHCIRMWKTKNISFGCGDWSPPFNDKLAYESLISQLIWRGRDYEFLQYLHPIYMNSTTALRPRRLAVEMSLNAIKETANSTNKPWFNAAFYSKETYISPIEMARWKYQIDLGGAGGTTWKGTLDKLATPSLLLHHETPAKDWFYDELIPWRHYVPVMTDLSDLKEKFDWAEAHPEDAATIAGEGTKFALEFFSNSRYQQEYKKFFGTNLGSYVDSYQAAPNESLLSIKASYISEDLKLVQNAKCTKSICWSRLPIGKYWQYRVP